MGTVRFPLYPARFLLVLGAVLLLLRLALDIVEDLGRLWRGEPPPAPMRRGRGRRVTTSRG